MVIIVMGVSGSGKTTIGKMLAESLGWPFLDADDFHPAPNVVKMSRGIPLNDADRIPWLERLRSEIQMQLIRGQSVVVACSALKKSYRRILSPENEAPLFLYLKGDSKLLRSRLESREGHFMKVNLLTSQLETLEVPDDAIVIDIIPPPETVIRSIQDALRGKLDLGKTQGQGGVPEP